MSADLRTAYIGARLIDPQQGFDAVSVVLVRDGVVQACGADIEIPSDAERVDCSGLVMVPGLIDMQVFTGEPGAEHRETLASISQSAAAGGVTRLVVMPNLMPVIDDAALVDFITRRARDTAVVHIHPMAAITRGCDGELITEFALLQEAGAIAFTDGDRAVMSALTMHRALNYAANFDALIVQHAMDSDFLASGVMNEGELATRLGLAGIPAFAETTIIERDIRLVAASGGRYHIGQISCAASVEIVRAAKARGLAVSCGVSANHLMLNENDVAHYRSFAKLNPPLRGEHDRMALIEGLGDGTIDVVVSGHNPQDAEAKRQPFAAAAYGAVGVETLLASLTTLYHEGYIDLSTLISKVTQNPAALLRLAAGTLSPTSPADFTLVALNEPWIVDANMLHSKSRNSAMDERRLQGRVHSCYVKGTHIFSN